MVLLNLPNFAEAEALVAGVDEVGRGALFGPVVAAVVVVPVSAIALLTEGGVKDSKQLSPKQRTRLALQIQQYAIATQIGWASVREIDRINILQASLKAMKRAIDKLPVTPELCLVDGNQSIPHLSLPQQVIVGGDRLSPVIAAASIVAKVWRDELIARLAKRYPHYDLAANKGYGTAKHRLALQKYGPCRQHRQSFAPCRVI